MEIPFLTLAALTRNTNDAGSGDRLNVTIDVAGIDVAVAEFVADHPRSRGYLRRAEAVVSFQTMSLTDSSVRIGTRGDDAWLPGGLFLFGLDTASGRPTQVIPLAEQAVWRDGWLSADEDEGHKVAHLGI